MSLRIIQSFFISAIVSLVFACGINSVTRAQLEAVQPGDVLTYRFQKDGKSWFYSDKVTKVENGRVYYNPSRTEATSGRSDIHDFDTRTELSIARTDFLNFADEFGPDKRVIIWINH